MTRRADWGVSQVSLGSVISAPKTYRIPFRACRTCSSWSFRLINSISGATADLTIAQAVVGKRSSGGAGMVAGTGVPVLVGGQASWDMPTDQVGLITDPATLVLAAGEEGLLSLYVDEAGFQTSDFNNTINFSYHQNGNVVAQEASTGFTNSGRMQLLDTAFCVDLETEGTIVGIGDSIMLAQSLSPAYSAALHVLQARLGPTYGAVNRGIASNTLCTAGVGPNVVTRFERDVLSVDGVRWVIQEASTNDISGGQSLAPLQSATLDLVELCHTRGLRYYAVTCLPRTSITGTKETVRQEFNAWLLSGASGADYVLDAAALLPDPTDLTYYSADGTHPNVAGQAVIGNAWPLSLFIETPTLLWGAYVPDLPPPARRRNVWDPAACFLSLVADPGTPPPPPPPPISGDALLPPRQRTAVLPLEDRTVRAR